MPLPWSISLGRNADFTKQLPSLYASRPHARKALLIGISYKGLGPELELNTVWHDVELLKNYLIDKRGYLDSDVTVMTDEEHTAANLVPHEHNVIREMQNLYQAQVAGDHYVFYFAGHTFQQETIDLQEEDHLDEYMLVLSTPSPSIAPDEGSDSKVVGIVDNTSIIIVAIGLQTGPVQVSSYTIYRDTPLTQSSGPHRASR
ncbi:hypothetical protein DXG01_005481 [Tephrocybe rancida]|nr:hypothetical protein DXG01_005481 [Tephrocybe rancida]